MVVSTKQEFAPREETISVQTIFKPDIVMKNVLFLSIHSSFPCTLLQFKGKSDNSERQLSELNNNDDYGDIKLIVC